MDDMHSLIESIQQDIFSYQLDAFAHRFLALVDLLTKGLKNLTPQDQAILNPVLSAILTAYERKDYLLLADLLEFELKPLLLAE